MARLFDGALGLLCYKRPFSCLLLLGTLNLVSCLLLVQGCIGIGMVPHLAKSKVRLRRRLGCLNHCLLFVRLCLSHHVYHLLQQFRVVLADLDQRVDLLLLI